MMIIQSTKFYQVLIVCILCFFFRSDLLSAESTSLEGEWKFQFDPSRFGINEKWYEKPLAEKISLPATTETAGLGAESNSRDPGRLNRIRPYNGIAWYQREIVIPDDWEGKRVYLFLERTKITRVWVDDKELGTQNSLVAPHVYELGDSIKPGAHRLTIMVKNVDYPPIGDSHQISDNTQTNWNGIIGKIELRITYPVWIDSARPFPDVQNKLFKIKLRLANPSGELIDGKITVSATTRNQKKETSVPAVTQAIEKFKADGEIEVVLPLGASAQTWDEFSPVFYAVDIRVEGTAGGKRFVATTVVPAGLKDFKANGRQFQVNGKTIFLRGKHDACVFPLTGHPPMDKEGWLRVMKISQSYGINHYRFHAWCPPAAAFEAADELGIYMQAELPNWANFTGIKEHDDFLTEEGLRIMKAYGNHPSFVMLSLGNELWGNRDIMQGIIKLFREADPRRLYAQGSNNYFGNPSQAPGDDFWVTMRTRHREAMVRGSFAHADMPLGRIQTGPADTLNDFTAAASISTIPVVGHETGQYTTFPDLNEIPKYTGVLRARNFEIIRDRLKEKGMLEQADDFTRASGRLAALCYRAEIELALRTPEFGGFQLLDLQDFPGQGTATVGILSAFMESKGLITPEEWRQSCSASTLLLRFPSYVWTADQMFNAKVEMAHYGKSDIQGGVVHWTLRDESRKEIQSGKLAAVDIPQGGLRKIGALEFSFEKVKKVPARFNLEVRLQDGSVSNEYPLWVYPPKVESSLKGFKVSKVLDSDTIKELNRGGKVILLTGGHRPQPAPMMFTTDFWCWAMFSPLGNPPGTQGLLMDPKHPALAGFPTEFHSNWQWFDICNAGWPLVLDSMPKEYRPIVQVIDDFTRCRRLGLISEFKCEGGQLLVVGCDLDALADKAPARQLMASLSDYVRSNEFNPQFELPIELQENLSCVNIALGKTATASTTRSEKEGPGFALDGDDSTYWIAADNKKHSWQVDLGEPQEVKEIELTFESKGAFSYLIEASTDGEAWSSIADIKEEKVANGKSFFKIQQQGLRYFRVTFVDMKGKWPMLREFRAFSKAK